MRDGWVSGWVVEEADSGYSGGSGGEALGGVFGGDTAEGVDRDGGGGCAGFAEAVEAGAGGDELARDGFFEDGAKRMAVGCSVRACSISAKVWQEMVMMGSGRLARV